MSEFNVHRTTGARGGKQRGLYEGIATIIERLLWKRLRERRPVVMQGWPEWARCYLNKMEESFLEARSVEGALKRTLQLCNASEPHPFTSRHPRSRTVQVNPPSLDEVYTAMRQLRNNRAPGENGTPAKINKTCLDSLGPWLHRVISKGWSTETVPKKL